ncbi:MAG: imidazole glycerol phosphate synthase subunit HisH [Candidatus Thorarchaeota archaeon SMTZ1-83]|nr:MAG: imidazole glycerol phosphate synthase subunit HisH [Candidatus Thorarchaeota archaeon SMTZ1-83]
MITIVDYGMGNLGSIRNMLTRLGFEVEISSDIQEIENATKLILPGVGAFDNAMKNLEERGMIPVLNELVLNRRVPILGICLGMQLLSQRSEEGNMQGLGWIEAETIRFRFNPGQNLRIPHMGWNTVTIQQDSCLFNDMYEEPRFYFVHSYHVKCVSEETTLARTHYGIDFTSAVSHDNIYGVQFHPEKSHKFGMKTLKNFAELC